MTAKYDDSPELAEGHDLPEAYVSHPPPEQVWSPQPSIAPTYVSQPPGTYGNNEGYTNSGAYSTTGTYSDAGKGAAAGAVGGVTAAAATNAGAEGAYSTHPESIHPEKKTATTVGGISLVLILSIIIGILAAAVIGLAAGTGVATKNYNDANSKLAVLSSSLAAAQSTSPPDAACATGTGTAAAPSSTAEVFNSLDNGCTDDPKGVNGTVYTSACKLLPYLLRHVTNMTQLLTTHLQSLASRISPCTATRIRTTLPFTRFSPRTSTAVWMPAALGIRTTLLPRVPV